VFTGAVAVLLVHAFDDAVLARGPGVGLGHHAAALALSVVVAVAAVWAFGRVRPAARALLALALAVPAGANVAMHVRHVADDRVAGADLTGLAAALACVALIGVAVVSAWRAWGTSRRPAPQRWALRLAAVPAAAALVPALVMPFAAGISGVHTQREHVGPAPAGYQTVAFRSTDGLRLDGWYHPSRTGAAVLIAHGGGSDRRGSMRHARMLARHGFGVLVYDTRGAGRSEGPHNSWGWDWERDAAGALAFLRARPDVEPERVGALGLSSGADGLVAMAARHHELGALVADGAAARTREDVSRDGSTPLGALSARVLFGASQLMSGTTPGRPLEDAARDLASPTLFVSTRRDLEYRLSRRYAQAAGPVATHWNLPGAEHTGAIRSHRGAYEARVVGFLEEHLGGR